MRISLEPAFILHQRPFRETSALLQIFTQNHGYLTLLVKGVRGKRSRFRGVLRSFVPLSISWSGRTELMCLSAAEIRGMPYVLQGDALFSGLYLNELLIRLLPPMDPYPTLFERYQTLLAAIALPEHRQALRVFEWAVLTALGYAPSLSRTADRGEAIDPSQYYCFSAEVGLQVASKISSGENCFLGEHLLSICQGRLEAPEVHAIARRIHALVLAPLLGNRPLKSRSYFQQAFVSARVD